MDGVRGEPGEQGPMGERGDLGPVIKGEKGRQNLRLYIIFIEVLILFTTLHSSFCEQPIHE